MKIMNRLMSLLGNGDLNRRKHYQPKIECKSQKTIKSPFPAAASIKKATNCECITLINKVLFKISCSLNTLDTIAAYFHQLEIGEG